MPNKLAASNEIGAEASVINLSETGKAGEICVGPFVNSILDIRHNPSVTNISGSKESRHDEEDNHPAVRKLSALEERFSSYSLEMKKLREIKVIKGGYLKVGGYEIKMHIETAEEYPDIGRFGYRGFSVFDARGVEAYSQNHRIPTTEELAIIIDAFPGKELFEQGKVAISLLNLPKIGLRNPNPLKRIFTGKSETAFLRTANADDAFVFTDRGVCIEQIGAKFACPIILIKS